jgi:hypothetical protein
VPESLAVLLLPGPLEGLAFEDHARSLLRIPRVVALEPSRVRTPRLLRDAAPLRQARRLRFPGRVRLIVLYHPAQYPLARALRGHHEDAELWYVLPGAAALAEARPAERTRLGELDGLARHHARATVQPGAVGEIDDAALRERLRELDVLSPYAFQPRVEIGRDRRRRLGRARREDL